jgi:excisionase family DNA binding protein
MKLKGTAEVAQALGCTPQTIRDWAAKGLLPSVRMGPKGRLRFDEASVAEAIKARQAEAQAGHQPAA